MHVYWFVCEYGCHKRVTYVILYEAVICNYFKHYKVIEVKNLSPVRENCRFQTWDSYRTIK